MHKTESVQENETQTFLGFWDTNGSPNLGQTTKPFDIQQRKKKNYQIGNFAVPGVHRVKLKEIEKRDNY